MTRLEAVSKVVTEYFDVLKGDGVLQRTQFDEADCKYLVGKIMAEIDRVEIDEAIEYADSYLSGIQDSQASYQEDINERKARQ